MMRGSLEIWLSLRMAKLRLRTRVEQRSRLMLTIKLCEEKYLIWVQLNYGVSARYRNLMNTH